MDENQARKRRRLIGVGFVLAFALSTATIIYTGLNVRAPGSAREAGASVAEPAPPAVDSAAEPSEPEPEPEPEQGEQPAQAGQLRGAQ